MLRALVRKVERASQCGSLTWRQLFVRGRSSGSVLGRVLLSGVSRRLPGHAYTTPPTIRPIVTAEDPGLIEDHLALQALIRAYQIRGHSITKLDPLGINEADLDSSTPAELIVDSKLDLEKVFTLPMTTRIGGDQTALPLKEIIARLKSVYCKNIGVEYMFINDHKKCDWIRERFERPSSATMDERAKKILLARLV